MQPMGALLIDHMAEHRMQDLAEQWCDLRELDAWYHRMNADNKHLFDTRMANQPRIIGWKTLIMH